VTPARGWASVTEILVDGRRRVRRHAVVRDRLPSEEGAAIRDLIGADRLLREQTGHHLAVRGLTRGGNLLPTPDRHVASLT